ncbi:MAG: hypothetical protein LBD94_03620 [Rickettsiales bacterium]|jgi:hypothetical protein|nr:hypothetical protein [Rickettsiales bacterium]
MIVNNISLTPLSLRKVKYQNMDFCSYALSADEVEKPVRDGKIPAISPPVENSDNLPVVAMLLGREGGITQHRNGMSTPQSMPGSIRFEKPWIFNLLQSIILS